MNFFKKKIIELQQEYKIAYGIYIKTLIIEMKTKDKPQFLQEKVVERFEKGGFYLDEIRGKA